MFKPLSFFIGLRYVRAKRQNGFISFISLASLLGIALGVTVLITVLSVMNGFDQQIRQKIFSLADQVTIIAPRGHLSQWHEIAEQAEKHPFVLASAPYINGEGMISKSGHMLPVMIKGIMPEKQDEVANMKGKFVSGQFGDLKAGEFGIILGSQLAWQFQVGVGDKVTLVSPQVTVSPMGVMPRYKRMVVKGVFQVGSGFGFDSTLGFVHLADARKLFGLTGDAVTGLRLKVDDLYHAIPVSQALKKQWQFAYRVTNWTEDYGQLFSAIRMEKTMMLLVMMLIITIAAFNLVSMLVMMVVDKQSEIAILRTQGATKRMITGIFIIQGLSIGIMGTVLGVLGGVVLSWYAPDIVAWLETVIRTHFVNENIYWIDHLPSALSWSDVGLVAGLTLIMSLLATLYPAYRAGSTQPAQALRYE